MSLTFHLFLPQMRLSHEAIVERALAAEAAGFEGIAFMDHLAPPLALEHGMWEAMSIAGWVLAKTSTLRVGHLVLCDTFRHPSMLAREAVSLDHASGGRFELGIGWGSVPAELVTFGVEPTEARDRVARLAETLAILEGLWSGEVIDFAGEHFTLHQAQQRPVPTAPIPITIGGTGPKTLALVREHADWWNVPVHQLDRLAQRRDQVGDVRVSVQVMVTLLGPDDDREEVAALVRRRFGGMAEGDSLVLGTPAEVTERFAELAERGIERVYAWTTDFAPPDTLARFGEVVAALR